MTDQLNLCPDCGHSMCTCGFDCECGCTWAAHESGGACDDCSCSEFTEEDPVPPLDRGCRWCQALPGEWCEDDCGAPDAAIHPAYRNNPTTGLWSKRNTPSGHFEAIKRSGNVFKGVKSEN